MFCLVIAILINTHRCHTSASTSYEFVRIFYVFVEWYHGSKVLMTTRVIKPKLQVIIHLCVKE